MISIRQPRVRALTYKSHNRSQTRAVDLRHPLQIQHNPFPLRNQRLHFILQ